jgi:hypothetical protein
MTQRIFVALLTVVVFGAGYAARLFTEVRHPVPPAPAVLTREMARSNATPADKKEERSLDRAKLLAEIEKARPQIEAFSGQLQEIDAEFDREFAALLNPAQKEKFASEQKKRAERMAKKLAKREPLSDEDIQREKEISMTVIYWHVTVTPRLEWLTKEYKLDANQQTQVRALLTLRRNKYIALYDASQHPSIRLSRLAPLIERVAAKSK